jgi:hypothetical protein
MPDLLCRHCRSLLGHRARCVLHPSRPCPACGEVADHLPMCDRQFDRSDFGALVLAVALALVVLAVWTALR